MAGEMARGSDSAGTGVVSVAGIAVRLTMQGVAQCFQTEGCVGDRQPQALGSPSKRSKIRCWHPSCVSPFHA
jgi:hypothetical protein